jgi:hypothetical protein
MPPRRAAGAAIAAAPPIERGKGPVPKKRKKPEEGPPPPSDDGAPSKKPRGKAAHKKADDEGAPAGAETVLKTALLKYLEPGDRGEQRGKVREALEKRVLAFSERVHLGSLTYMAAARLLFDGAADVRDALVPARLFDQSFVRQAFLGTGQVHPLVQQVHLAHPHIRKDPAADRFESDGNMYTHGARAFLTNVKNALQMNLVPHVRSFVRAHAELNKRSPAERATLQALILGQDTRGKTCVFPIRREDAELVARHRACLGLAEAAGEADGTAAPRERTPWELLAHVPRYREWARGVAAALAAERGLPVGAVGALVHRASGLGSAPRADMAALVTDQIRDEMRARLGLQGDYDQDRHLATILRYFVLQLREREALGLPLFNLVPVCKVRRHFITVDKDVLHGVLRDAGIIDLTLGQFRALDAPTFNALYESVFKLRKLLGTRRGAFTNTIETDGIALCTHYRVPRDGGRTRRAAANASRAFEPLADDRVVALDPGRVNIYYCVEVAADGTERTYVLTRRQYYEEGGVNRAKDRSATWLEGVAEPLDALTHVSTKGASMQRLTAFLAVHAAQHAAFRAEKTKARWGRQSLALYIGKRSVLDTFYQRIRAAGEPGRRIVVAYGNGSFPSTGRGELAVPTKWAYEAMCQAFLVVLVDEYRTTAVNHLDDRVLEKVAGRVPKGRGRGGARAAPAYRPPVRDLLWCPSTTRDARGKFVNREKNAALNIHRCYMAKARGAARPDALTRRTRETPELPELPQLPERATRFIRTVLRRRRQPGRRRRRQPE